MMKRIIYFLIHFLFLESILGSSQTNSQIPNLVNQSFSAAAGTGNGGNPSINSITNTIGQQLNGATGGKAAGIINQITSISNNQPVNQVPTASSTLNNQASGKESTKETITEAIQGALTGIDPTSIDAEPKMDMTTDASAPAPGTNPNAPPTDSGNSGNSPNMMFGPDLDLMWNCKHNPAVDKEQCAKSMQLFCSGFCSRLNWAILTNRVTCLEICSDSNPMMEPCVEAGKRKRGVQKPPQTFNVSNPNAPPKTSISNPVATPEETVNNK